MKVRDLIKELNELKEELIEKFAAILSRVSQVGLEKSLEAALEEIDHTKKRQSRFQGGGFKVRKAG